MRSNETSDTLRFATMGFFCYNLFALTPESAALEPR
jgi:hypothetical protein